MYETVKTVKGYEVKRMIVTASINEARNGRDVA